MDFEIKIIQFLQAGRSPFFDVSFQVITMLGSIFALVAFLLFLFFYNRKLAFTYVLSYGFVYLIINTIKTLVGRARPFAACSDVELIGKISSDFSFPSGHTACAMAIAIFLGVFLFEKYKDKNTRIWTIVCLMIYVGFVALSRMYLGVHYLTDVLAGAAVSALICAIGIVVMKIYQKKGRKNETSDGNE